MFWAPKLVLPNAHGELLLYYCINGIMNIGKISVCWTPVVTEITCTLWPLNRIHSTLGLLLLDHGVKGFKHDPGTSRPTKPKLTAVRVWGWWRKKQRRRGEVRRRRDEAGSVKSRVRKNPLLSCECEWVCCCLTALQQINVITAWMLYKKSLVKTV